MIVSRAVIRRLVTVAMAIVGPQHPEQQTSRVLRLAQQALAD